MQTQLLGNVSHIQRFSISDGPGVRTTVFLKGCPLACLWCHNPETQADIPSLLYYPQSCAQCRACAAACPSGAHIFGEEGHAILREKCALCGLCAGACPARALEMRGERMSAKDVLSIVLRDRMFYETTGGGVTLSGGEPLHQLDFARALLAEARAEGLHTCLDTSGFGGGAAGFVPLVDLFLWDVKETDPERHRAATGVELFPLLESLRAVDAAGGRTLLRCPVIPGVNDRQGHMLAIAGIANGLLNVQGIELIPYHSMGLGKAQAIGMEQMAYESLSPQARDALLEALRLHTAVPALWKQ